MNPVKPFNFLAMAQAVSDTDDWRSALDALIHISREGLIYDNLVVYITSPIDGSNEVFYARAVGRGQSAGADAAWGQEVADEVMRTGQAVHVAPSPKSSPAKDRLKRPYLLGLPLRAPQRVIGALVLVRFGSPEFTTEQEEYAAYTALQIGFLVERHTLLQMIRRLDDAKRQIQLQEDFIATMSHELRTPLGFIKGYATTLLRSDTTWDAATTREFLTIIEEEADRLSALINSILESARLESKTLSMSFQPVRLETLVRDLILRYTSRDPSLQFVLHAEQAPVVQADLVRMTQVFDNLISNAIKYAPGSAITITLTEKDNMALASFHDDGQGIPPEHLPYIFERFYRVGSGGGSGTGLGLFICNQIVQAHFGKMWVESKQGQGATFFVEIPITQSAPQ